MFIASNGFHLVACFGASNLPRKLTRQASAGKVDTKSAELVDETGGIFDANLKVKNVVGKKQL